MAIGQHTVSVSESIDVLTWTRPKVGESIAVQKWHSPQGGQVYYTDAAAGHQITVAVFSL